MGEHERCLDDGTDLAWADRGVLQGTPAAGQQREPTFAQAAKAT